MTGNLHGSHACLKEKKLKNLNMMKLNKKSLKSNLIIKVKVSKGARQQKNESIIRMIGAGIKCEIGPMHLFGECNKFCLK